jgi:glycosyltransferase involved in cell wall biosynthesis
LRACSVAYSFYEGDGRVRRYAECLVAHGYEVDALGARAKGLPMEDTVIGGVNVFYIQQRAKTEKSKFIYLMKHLLFFVRSMFILTWKHIRKPYDLIHVHSLPDFEVFAAWYPKLLGAKVILDIHDITPEFYISKFNVSSRSVIFKALAFVERISCGFANHVIVSNHIWQKRLEQRSIEAPKVTTILNFPDTEIFHKIGKQRTDDKFIMVYPGSLNYHQGLDIAIRAFSLIAHEAPKAEFHIYGGGGDFDSLKSLIAELELSDRVLLKGSYSIDHIRTVVEDSDLGVVPKRKSLFGDEAFSTKILEFMSLGIPVIVPDTTIDTYYFNPTVVQFFHANDERSLADTMLRLIRDPKLRENLVKNADEFMKNYTWQANKEIYLNLVDSLVNQE